jgi:hypothetical protein
MIDLDDRDFLDATLHLLDRQILDDDGRMVAKVDDAELVVQRDGSLAVPALLTGPGALAPRFGGFLGAFALATWSRLSERPGHAPKRIDVDHVAKVGTVVTLGVPLEEVGVDGFEVWARERVVAAIPGSGHAPDKSTRSADAGSGQEDESQSSHGLEDHRMTQLLGMPLKHGQRRLSEHVIDVRLRHREDGALVVAGLLTGHRRPGTWFGYDRNDQMGPWLIRVLVRGLHRDTGYVPWSEVDSVDWESGGVALRTGEVHPLPSR